MRFPLLDIVSKTRKITAISAIKQILSNVLFGLKTRLFPQFSSQANNVQKEAKKIKLIIIKSYIFEYFLAPKKHLIFRINPFPLIFEII